MTKPSNKASDPKTFRRTTRSQSRESAAANQEQETGEEVMSPTNKLKNPKLPPQAKINRQLALAEKDLEELEDDEEITDPEESEKEQEKETDEDQNEPAKKKAKKEEERKEREKALQKSQDARRAAEAIKKGIEAERKKEKLSTAEKAKAKLPQMSKDQINRARAQSEMLIALQTSMKNIGEPASREELNEALELMKIDTEVDYSHLIYFLKGMRRGVWLKANQGDGDPKKVVDMFLTTHKQYAATLQGFERLLFNSTTEQRLTQAKNLPKLPEKVTSSVKSVVPVKTLNFDKPKKENLPKDVKVQKETLHKEKFDGIPLESKSTSTIVKDLTLKDYCGILRISLKRFLKVNEVDESDFISACESFEKEEWNNVRKDLGILGDFSNKVVMKAKEIHGEKNKDVGEGERTDSV